MSRAVKPRKKRIYRSPRRAEQAEATRRRILDGARTVFIARGFAGTTMTQIAAEAGTAVETIYAAFGTKVELLRQCMHAVLMPDGKAPHRQDGAEAVRLEPDPRKHLELFAHHISFLLDGVHPLMTVLASARAEPELGALYTRMQENRYANLRVMIGWLADKGGLRRDVTPDAAAETVWALANPELYHLLVEQRGWTREQFASWLAATLIAALVPPAPAGVPSRR